MLTDWMNEGRLEHACRKALRMPAPGNTKGGSITVPLTSSLTGLEPAVWLLTIFVFICKTDSSKLVKQEVNGTVILPPLVFPARTFCTCACHHSPHACMQLSPPLPLSISDRWTGFAYSLHQSERERERGRNFQNCYLYFKKEWWVPWHLLVI